MMSELNLTERCETLIMTPMYQVIVLESNPSSAMRAGKQIHYTHPPERSVVYDRDSEKVFVFIRSQLHNFLRQSVSL